MNRKMRTQQSRGGVAAPEALPAGGINANRRSRYATRPHPQRAPYRWLERLIIEE
jgi:hypothetical protein